LIHYQHIFFILKVNFDRLAEGTVELQNAARNAALLGNTWDLKISFAFENNYPLFVF
jgi:hypothetical protein